MSKSVDVYLESIQMFQGRITKFSEIETLHNVSKSLALKYFNEEKKFGNEDESTPYKNQLIEKLDKAYDDWRPITMDFLNKIKNEQLETEKQKALAETAKLQDERAKQHAAEIEKKQQELQKQLEQARYDTIESRRESELIKRKLEQAKKDIAEAWQREQEAKAYYENIRRHVEGMERQLSTERELANERMKHQVTKIRKRDGLLQLFGDAFVGFLSKVGKFLNSINPFA
jgi:chromosome segregation ATPase